MMIKSEEKTKKDLTEQQSCIFGKEVKEICPVAEAYSKPTFNDYANPVSPIPPIQGLDEVAAGLQAMSKQMMAAMKTELARLAPFCASCPYPRIYVAKQKKEIHHSG